jgi:hypothetical protein
MLETISRTSSSGLVCFERTRRIISLRLLTENTSTALIHLQPFDGSSVFQILIAIPLPSLLIPQRVSWNWI